MSGTDMVRLLEKLNKETRPSMLRTYSIFLEKVTSWYPKFKIKKKKIITSKITSDKANEIMDLCRQAGYDVRMFWYNWP